VTGRARHIYGAGTHTVFVCLRFVAVRRRLSGVSARSVFAAVLASYRKQSGMTQTDAAGRFCMSKSLYQKKSISSETNLRYKSSTNFASRTRMSARVRKSAD
jgi:hypothetical protein